MKENNKKTEKPKKKKSLAGRISRIIIRIITLIPLAIFSVILACNIAVRNTTSDKLYNSIEKIPKRNVCVVLGTTPNKKGQKNGNSYFFNRINAATKLYKAGKVKTIIVSGDSSKYYDETKMMRDALVKRGVPRSAIKLDTKGKGTFESMLQMKNHFKINKFTIVTQAFQNERAIFIANHYGLDAIGFNAQDIDIKKGYRVYFREAFARVKVFLDILKAKY